MLMLVGMAVAVTVPVCVTMGIVTVRTLVIVVAVRTLVIVVAVRTLVIVVAVPVSVPVSVGNQMKTTAWHTADRMLPRRPLLEYPNGAGGRPAGRLWPGSSN